MAGDLTFAMIKPDAVQQKQVGKIITMIEQAGFKLCNMRLTRLTSETAGILYQAHKDYSYYEAMCAFIVSGPVVAMVLEKENAVAEFDELKEIIRSQFSTSRTHNAIHGADTAEAVHREITLLFLPTSTDESLS